MINRSSIKYHLKKILPKSLFRLVVLLWRGGVIRLVEAIDALRLRRFTSYRAVTLTHRKKEFSLYISPKNGFIDNYIFLYGVYEPFILDLMSIHLREGMTFVDIGANIGEHTMYAATLVGQSGNVYSFEPIPHIYMQLNDSVRKNHFEKIITTKNIALGEYDIEQKLHVSKNVGGSSLVHDDDTQETITVHVKNGDKELAHIENIDMIKIDVEGYEYEVLHGIKSTLLKHKPTLLLEFSGELYKKQERGHGAKILSLLRECNYSLFDIEDDMNKVTDDSTFDHRISTSRKQTNLLCVYKSL